MLYEEGSRDKRRIANVICGQPERFTFCTKRKDLSHTIMKIFFFFFFDRYNNEECVGEMKIVHLNRN